MTRIRIFELARQLGMDGRNNEIIEVAKRLHIPVKTASSSIEDYDADRIRKELGNTGGAAGSGQEEEPKKKKPKTLLRKSRNIEKQPEVPETTEEAAEEETAAEETVVESPKAASAPGTDTEPAGLQAPADTDEQTAVVGEPSADTREDAAEASTEPEQTEAVAEEAAAPSEAAPREETPVTEATADTATENAEQETAAADSSVEEKPQADADGPKVKKIKLPKSKQVSKIVGRIEITPEMTQKRQPRQVRTISRPSSQRPDDRGRRPGGGSSRFAQPQQQPEAPAAPGSERQRDVKKKSDAYRDTAIGGHRKRKVVEDLYPERLKRQGRRKKGAVPTGPLKAVVKTLKVGDSINVAELARRMGIKGSEVVKKLFEMGMMVTVNQVIDFETASLVASEFECTLEFGGFEENDFIGQEEDRPEDMKPRPPVVTVMGHVDHGKTSLLDAIRATRITASEAGGITQHIGAYLVKLESGTIAFIDTPGHEAFTAMRARGAQLTDIVILVVAADDGVMPQTIEAINHSKAAGAPIIVAINKIDKADANVPRVRTELMQHGLVDEAMGGDTMMVEVSAKSKIGIEKLLESVLLQAEVMELTANVAKKASGTVVEAQLDRGRGPVATFLVQSGTLKVGDNVVCGHIAGRIRSMIDDQGRPVKKALPSTPVEVIGMEAVPAAGEIFNVLKNEKESKQLASHRAHKMREAQLAKAGKRRLDQMFQDIDGSEKKKLAIIIKGDVQGSIEALRDAFVGLSNDEVSVEVIHQGVGGITETDVLLASTSNALIIGFNVRPEAKVGPLAARQGVEIKQFSIIYDAVEELKLLLTGMLEPQFEENILGRAEVRQIFNITKVGTIAGCFVQEGHILRKAKVRLLRDSAVVYTGEFSSLKRFKDDAKEVTAGQDCGIQLKNFNDIKPGDVIEAYEMQELDVVLQPGRKEDSDN